jgi:hypothetical protein
MNNTTWMAMSLVDASETMISNDQQKGQYEIEDPQVTVETSSL